MYIYKEPKTATFFMLKAIFSHTVHYTISGKCTMLSTKPDLHQTKNVLKLKVNDNEVKKRIIHTHLSQKIHVLNIRLNATVQQTRTFTLSMTHANMEELKTSVPWLHAPVFWNNLQNGEKNFFPNQLYEKNPATLIHKQAKLCKQLL